MLNNCHALSHLTQTRAHDTPVVRPPPDYKGTPRLCEGAGTILELAQLRSRQLSSAGAPRPRTARVWACLDRALHFSYTVRQRGTPGATERRGILARIRIGEPAGQSVRGRTGRGCSLRRSGAPPAPPPPAANGRVRAGWPGWGKGGPGREASPGARVCTGYKPFR